VTRTSTASNLIATMSGPSGHKSPPPRLEWPHDLEQSCSFCSPYRSSPPDLCRYISGIRLHSPRGSTRFVWAASQSVVGASVATFGRREHQLSVDRGTLCRQNLETGERRSWKIPSFENEQRSRVWREWTVGFIFLVVKSEISPLLPKCRCAGCRGNLETF
jgi:hypothetical protein